MADNTVLPTTDDLAKKASLPTTDELAGQADNHGAFSGALSDAYFALGAPNRILHSFSQSAAQAWGASQDQLSPETSAYRSGGSSQLPKEYHEGRSAVLKAANESWMRSAAHGIWDRMNSAARVVNYGLTHPLNTALGVIDAGVQGVPSAIEGVAEELGHTGQYLRENDNTQIGLGRVVGYPLSAVGELVSGAGQGALIPEVPHAVFLDHGRAVGAIGESEGKYFGTSDLTARDHSARAEAVAQTIKDRPDIHEAARQYAPDAFAHYDSLQDVREHFKSELDRHTTERGFDPEYKKAQTEANDILESVNHDESELTEEKANRLSSLRDQLEADSPGMTDARKTLSDVEGRITDLSPHIHEAYQLADAGNRVLNPDAVPEKEAPKTVPKSAEELSNGEIAKDVEAKLLKAGRPADEAKIAGILYQQRYENRVSKSPHLGTAEELYKNEGPDILRGTEGKDGGDALNQYVGSKAFRGTKEGLTRSKKLSTAVKMESAGNTPEQISLATGWVRSPFDKKWKYEITDKDASLTQAFHDLPESKIFGETHEMKLGDALKHDRLFEAYPEAKDIRVTKRPGLFDFGSLQGSFDEKGNVLNLTPYAKDHLSTALHEIQHWVQSKEGFARGGNESTVFEHLSPEKKAKLFEEAIIKTKRALSEVAQKLDVFKKAMSHLDEVDVTAYRQLKKYSDDLWKDLQRLEKKDKEDGLPVGEKSSQTKAANHDWHVAYTEATKLEQDIHKTLFDGKRYLELPEAVKSVSIDVDKVLEGKKTPEEIIEKGQKEALAFQELLSKLHQGDEKVLKKAVGDAGYRFYRAIAGEIEARDTQARKDLTEEERAKTAPYDSQSDIDHDDVITHFGDKENELFQREEKAPGFFSALHKSVRELTMDKAHPQDWLGIIDNLKGVKKEEIDWSGVKTWLGQQYRNGVKTVSKAEVLQHLEDNEVEVHEVPKFSQQIHDEANKKFDELQKQIDVLDQKEEKPEGLSDHEEELRRQLYKEQDELSGLHPKAITKYDSYTLPGGKSYKEIVLTKRNYPSIEKQINRLTELQDNLSVHDPKWDELQKQLVQLHSKRSESLKDRTDYTTPHWDEKNVLAHIRFDERVGPNGERVLHIAEIQSDWHQQGRKHGYQDPKEYSRLLEAEVEAQNRLEIARDEVTKKEGFNSWYSLNRAIEKAKTDEEKERLLDVAEKIEADETIQSAKVELFDARSKTNAVASGVPDAPFKSGWHELALKRMIRYAAENGFNRVSWDTGKTNVERYNLEKQVKLLIAERHGPDEIYINAFDHDNHHVITKSVKDEKELTNLVGKDVAQKIIQKLQESEAAGDSRESLLPQARLEGPDLRIGGEGMKGFYDKILPDAANKLGKKFGSKVSDSKIQAGETGLKDLMPDATPEERMHAALTGYYEKGEVPPSEPKYENVHSLDITPEMKKSVLENGQSLFQQKKGSLTRGTPRNIIKLFRAADASTFFHETGHQWLEELVKDGSHPDASPELRADLEAARDFLGNKGEPLTRAQHEKFARSFERYLREGHAPTKELKVLFDKFKEWLTEIYKTLRDLPNSKIDDSIRDVFDRLIVSERTRDVVTNDAELEQRGTTRQRERDLQNHIQEIKEQARTRQIYKFMSEVRERAAASKGQLTDKRYIGPESDQVKEGMPLPEPTPAETESGTADTETNTGEESEGDPNAKFKSKGGPFVDNAGNIRVENLTSDQDLADSIKLAYEVNKDELDKSRGKISSQATIDLAEAGGIASKDINMKALIRAAQNGGIPLSSYIHLLRNAFLESAKHLKGVMEGNDEIAYAEASTRHMALSRHLMGITAEWGRAGHSFRSLAEEAREAQELNEFMQMSLGKTLKQLKSEMAFGRYLDSPKKVSGFVQDMSKTGYGEWILEMFKNWLISGPITHMTYAVGNEIFALNRLLEATARVGLSSLRSEDPQGSHIGEVRERMYGLMSGHLDGLRAAWDSFNAGQTALLPGEEHATTAFTQHKAIPDFKVGPVNLNLGSAVRLPSERMVAPLHSFARSVAFAEERNGLIFRKAYGEGLRGDALERRIAELKNNVPVDITVAARAAASESALMGRAGDFTRKAVAVINSPLELPQWAGGTWRPGGFIAPFITVSSNINRLALLERSPIGLASKTVRDDLFGKNGRFKQDVAASKMAVGTGIGIAAGTLYAMEVANPAAPEDFKHATVFQAVNGLPHSIRIGEMSYDLSRLGVLGTTFSTALDIAAFSNGVLHSIEKGDHHIAEEAAVTWFHSIADHLETEGFMSGISDLMKAVNDSDRYGESWAKNFVSSLVVPYSVGMSQIAQRIDPYQRDTKGIDALDSISRAIRAKIPFESETLEEKVDLFGQPVPSKEYWGVYATRMSQDPAWIALKDIGYFPAPVKRTINGVKLTPHQYHDYATKAGITAKLLLDNVVNMEGFSELDATTKHELVKDAITSGRQSAAEIVKAESVGSDNDIMKHATELKDQLGKTE